jgi:hypothetical protein
MSIKTTIIEKLHSISRPTDMADGFSVSTHCIYPSNTLVRVSVRVGQRSAVVSDDGGAIGEASAAGIWLGKPDKMLDALVKPRGLIVRGGVINSKEVEFDAVPYVILHVANVARDVANWFYDHGGVQKKQDFRPLLIKSLKMEFRDNLSAAKIAGASNKVHKFPNVIHFANGKQIIVDSVANDPQSINARVVANVDVRDAHNERIQQRIVFDDNQRWSPSDLSLLKIGATPVPFSKAKAVIGDLAQRARHN